MQQYASFIGLNSNDDEHANVTSYSTRVERVQKLPGSHTWTLTLRKIESLPFSAEGYAKHDDLRVEWWTEEFDAVVVGSAGESDAPYVPPIPGLAEWAHKFPEHVYHVRDYRIPEEVKGKVSTAVFHFLRFEIQGKFRPPNNQRSLVECFDCRRFPFRFWSSDGYDPACLFCDCQCSGECA